MSLIMYGLWFNLLGLNSSPCTVRNPNTTSTSKSLYIYRQSAQCIKGVE